MGGSLSPKVVPLSQLSNTGAGSPDFGLFAANQIQKGEPRKGQMPERGVVEVKAVADDSLFKSTPAQLSKYFNAYRLVLVTNLRGFQLVGEDVNGTATRLEAFTIAETAADFWTLVQTPAASAKAHGLAFIEYLRRALTQNVALVQPKDVAWFLASYARDALARVDAAGDLPALKTVRTALEDALGITFDQEKGDHFFRSTLVQTLFYGLFSAWVIWARTTPRNPPRFDWRSAGCRKRTSSIIAWQQYTLPTIGPPMRAHFAWIYTLGGYQVLKKWLSYREATVLGRALTGEEALHFAKTARRITEILCMGPALDAAHSKARNCAVPWVDGKPAEPSLL